MSLVHIAETNSLLDIKNVLGDNPAESHAPESSLIVNADNRGDPVSISNLTIISS